MNIMNTKSKKDEWDTYQTEMHNREVGCDDHEK